MKEWVGWTKSTWHDEDTMVQEQNGMINNTRNAHDKSRSTETTKSAYRSMDRVNQRTDQWTGKNSDFTKNPTMHDYWRHRVSVLLTWVTVLGVTREKRWCFRSGALWRFFREHSLCKTASLCRDGLRANGAWHRTCRGSGNSRPPFGEVPACSSGTGTGSSWPSSWGHSRWSAPTAERPQGYQRRRSWEWLYSCQWLPFQTLQEACTKAWASGHCKSTCSQRVTWRRGDIRLWRSFSSPRHQSCRAPSRKRTFL